MNRLISQPMPPAFRSEPSGSERAFDLTKLQRAFVLALRSLWLHKLRSFLSVLGIIIGTGAVIALMAFGEGSMQDALDDIKRQGATNVIVRSVKPADENSHARKTLIAQYGLTYTDLEAFDTIPDVRRAVPMRIFPQEVRRGGAVTIGRVVGTWPDYAEVYNLPLAVGRFLCDEDNLKRENVVVLGSTVADQLFPYGNVLNETVVIRGQHYRIVGVLRDRVPLGGGANQSAEDFNADLYMPLATCRGRFGDSIFIRASGSRSGEKVQLHQIILTLSDVDKVRPTGELIREMLEQRHAKKDWSVTVPLDRLEEAERQKTRFTRLLVLIASISLIVGGIGIMNIMLATVTERTREIGIRRALGAKRRDITQQFLVEAVVQTGVGGLCGVGLGLATVFVLPPLVHVLTETHLPAKVHVPAIFLALGVSVGVGVLFGWYPARSAARLDPIEALRHD